MLRFEDKILVKNPWESKTFSAMRLIKNSKNCAQPARSNALQKAVIPMFYQVMLRHS